MIKPQQLVDTGDPIVPTAADSPVRAARRGPPGPTGPPLILPAAAFAGLFIASLVVLAVRADAAFPSPYSSGAEILAFFDGSGDAVQLAATLQFAACVPLAVLAAVVSARLHTLGGRNPGSTIALVGGALASAFLGTSALLQWVLSRDEIIGSPELVRALHSLAFLTGGPAHVAGLGLLLAAVAVPALLLRLLPRAVAVAGLAIAVVCELSVLALAFEPAAVLLPLGRFPAIGWVVVSALMLPVSRPRRTGADADADNRARSDA